MSENKGSYETFDSAGGPTNAGNGGSAHRDKELMAEGDAGQDKNLGVPEVPMNK